jgi:hypothetical protein
VELGEVGARSGGGNAHWQTKADIPFSPHGGAARQLRGAALHLSLADARFITEQLSTGPCAAIVIAFVWLLSSCHWAWLQSPQREAARGGRPLLSPELVVRKQSAGRRRTGALVSRPAGHGTERACAAPRPSRRSACFWPTRMQRDDVLAAAASDIARMELHSARDALSRRAARPDIHSHAACLERGLRATSAPPHRQRSRTQQLLAANEETNAAAPTRMTSTFAIRDPLPTGQAPSVQRLSIHPNGKPENPLKGLASPR